MILILLIAGVSIVSVGASVLDYRTYKSPLRSILILISGVLLIGFILENDRSKAGIGPIILLTDGASEAEIPANSEATVFSLESADNQHSDDVRWLSAIYMLSDVADSGNIVQVYGHGTHEPLGDGFRWVDNLRSPGPGIMLEQAPQQVDAGKNFSISGRLISDTEVDSVTLYRDGDPVSSKSIGSDGVFSFTDQLRVEGPALYHIEAETADTLLSEPLHIRALAPDPLAVAVLLYSPSFEITHLAEWLGNNGNRLAMRTRIGNDRFRFDEVNDPPAAASGLEKDLSSFDLVILDPREVSELSVRQIQSVRLAIENGLDVLLLPPSENSERNWEEAMKSISGEAIELNPVSRIEERKWTPEFITLSEEETTVNARLPILNFNFSRYGKNAVTPGLFENREPVISRIPVGQGSVTSHLFYQSYTWKLRGEQDFYAGFWADYLDQAITLESPFVELDSGIPKLRNRVMLTTSGAELTVRHPAQNQKWKIPLVAGADHQGVSVGYFWPRSAGWHVAESGEANRWFYVYDTGWTFDEAYHRYMKTKQEIAAASVDMFDDVQSDGEWFPNWAWLVGFLFLQMILWTERKLVG